ncbi:hypothetical protein CIHG_08110 [Coccidioides immitis H538.4]|uniref:Uncharacterized protein n=3 Tax=Coccidioides immitis TaxID=5501 RepID=A0A0J8R3Y4_COCIT|nr:hypothetical protein CIRG_02028 [Coccidioides immitis RMSCC 2394]KMU79080.1 hypothetical protein CISG_07246 [Coccidioides immitis RMSCC 3703]KMU90301.1 hypothetical protein CIHG_08110 [Coccidioides immitis H538.4]
MSIITESSDLGKQLSSSNIARDSPLLAFQFASKSETRIRQATAHARHLSDIAHVPTRDAGESSGGTMCEVSYRILASGLAVRNQCLRDLSHCRANKIPRVCLLTTYESQGCLSSNGTKELFHAQE